MTFWDKVDRSVRAAMSAWAGSEPVVQASPQPDHQGVTDYDAQRIERYKLLWEYYRGEHRKHLKPIKTPDGRLQDDNIVINLSRRVVNKGVYFLFGKPLIWQLTEGTDTPEEVMLERIWGSHEKRMTFLAELALNGGVTGDFYLQIVPPAPGEELPRVINLDPSTVFVKTDPNDIEKEWAFDLRWESSGRVCRTMHALNEDGLDWSTWDEIWNAGRWEQMTEPELWGFPYPMIVHGKNLPSPNSYWGCSDLEDADLNDAINLVASNISRITRIFAHPFVWGYGFGRDGKGIDISGVALSDDPQAKMGALELGRDMSSAQEYLKFLRTAFAEVTGVPESDPDRMAIGAQSGFALEVLFNDLVLKTGLKRSLYGSALVECNRRLLDMMGMGDKHVVKLHWQNPLPVDDRAEREGQQFDIDYKLASRKTISEKRGYNYDAEVDRLDLESDPTERATRAQNTDNSVMSPE